MPRAAETAKFFDVQMQQPACSVVLVAMERPGWLQAGHAVKPFAAEQAGDGAVPNAQALADLTVGLSTLPSFDDLLPILRTDAMRTVVWARGSVVQSRQALLAIAFEPLVSGPHTDTGRLRSLLGAQPLLKDASNQQGSTMDC